MSAQDTTPTPAADWIDFEVGSPCPVLLEERVEVRLRNGQSRQDQAGALRWSARDYTDGYDIIAYRVVSPTPASAAKGEAVDWSDWPRQSHDRRYEIGLREDQNANQHCPFCDNEIDQTCEVVIIADNGSLALCHAACLPEECETALQPHPSQQAGTEGELREAADALVNGFAWSAVRPDCQESHDYLQELINRVRAALNPSEARR